MYRTIRIWWTWLVVCPLFGAMGRSFYEPPYNLILYCLGIVSFVVALVLIELEHRK